MCYCQPDDADWVTGKNIIAVSENLQRLLQEALAGLLHSLGI